LTKSTLVGGSSLISISVGDYSTALVSLLAAIVFALVNFYSFRLRSYTGKHKNQILSLFGGVTAAYVFLDLLPSLQISNEYLKELGSSNQVIILYEDAIFLVIFLGFLLFFSLESMAVKSREDKIKENQELNKVKASRKVYLVHFSALAFLTFVLSFTLMFEYQASILSGLLFTFAVSLHLFITDNTLMENYEDRLLRTGRYIATIIPLAGWLASVVFPEKIAEAYILLAFISGAILYQSIKDEIPSVYKKRSIALFLTGAILYALLLLGYSLSSHYLLSFLREL